MRLPAYFKFLIITLIAVSFSPCFAQEDEEDEEDEIELSSFKRELNERDLAILKDFLRTKMVPDLKDKSENLRISGDVRTEWRHMNETADGIAQRGHGAKNFEGLPIPHNDFDIEANLRFDFKYDKAWMVAHIQFDNPAGVDDNGHPGNEDLPPAVKKSQFFDPFGYHGSGKCDGLCLKKAFMGYNIFDYDDSRLDVELGRRKMYDVFDSQIQFLSRFDGIIFKYANTHYDFAEWYARVASFLIDERVTHFGFATEWGFLNIKNSGFDVKYSFIHWNKYGKNRFGIYNPRGFRSRNSQLLVAYNTNPKLLWCKPTKIYAAAVYNHAARKWSQESVDEFNAKHGTSQTKIPGRKPWGWYVGVRIGDVDGEGDWATELQYQLVQAQCMPDNDSGGIGRGNVRNESWTAPQRRGNTNFKGWRWETLYGLTDNLTLDMILESSIAEDSADLFGGSHTYSKFELEAIYAF